MSLTIIQPRLPSFYRFLSGDWGNDITQNQCHKDKGYKIKIDKQPYTVPNAVVTGAELLRLAGKPADNSQLLFQKLRGGQVDRIELEDEVDLSTPGREKFMTVPNDQREGRPGPRKDFHLPQEDIDDLEAAGLEWECVKEGNIQRLIIRDLDIPDGYNVKKVDIYLRIEPNYPDTQIDMAYFHPHLSLQSGKAIKALATESFMGQTWQRWSRHRTPQNPWRPGIDCVITHLQQVRAWMESAK